MLVVISDLHFEEEAGNHIRIGGRAIQCDGNIGPAAFRRFVAAVEESAVANEAERIDLVLAGDIFDLHRTSLWLDEPADGLRPYVSCGEVVPGSPLEAKLLLILERIAGEPKVASALEALRALGLGDQPVPTQRYYLPGNHDRLLNATPALRSRVRELLDVDGGDAPFPHHYLFTDPRVLVRHGHEYDHLNFSADHRKTRRIPPSFPDHEYDSVAFGDLVTVDLASRLPWQFRRHHGDAAIVASPLLEAVYRRLLDFDDVRPQSALLNFLLRTPGYGEKEVWRTVAPVLRAVLAELHGSAAARRLISRLPFFAEAVVRDLLQRSADGQELSHRELRMLEKLLDLLPGGGESEPVQAAERESVIAEGKVRFVVSGHTHRGQVALLRQAPPLDCYYVDTGTWRHRIAASPDRTGFGRVKALTYVVIWASGEDRSGDGPKTESFDFWDGVTERWSA